MSVYVATGALILAYLALVGVYFSLRSAARLRHSTAVLARSIRSNELESLLTAAEQSQEQQRRLTDEIAQLHSALTTARTETRNLAATQAKIAETIESKDALSRVALVRYDAFSDITGRMSFSLAVLDDSGSGVTLSAISGRNDTRLYAKSVVAGNGEQALSPEETQAVAAAFKQPRSTLLRRSA